MKHQYVSSATSVQDVRGQRSDKLIELTDTHTSLPSFEDAMNSTNFPFVEGPRQCRGINYGVVKLKNVSS